MEELIKFATIDTLTGIFNRREFFEQAQLILEKDQQWEKKFSFMLLDFDHFKNINDTYGHSCGDYVLQTMAKTISQKLPDDGIFGRVGGEEFAIILSDSSIKKAHEYAEELRAYVEKKELSYEGHKFHISVSIGVTEYNSKDKDIKDVFKEADKLLYKAKESGRNCVCVEQTQK